MSHLNSKDKGFIPVGNGSGAFGILPVGANGTVLTADSATPEGVKWGAAGGGGFSAGGVIAPVGLPLVGDTTLFTVTPPAGDYLFTFTTLWEQGGGTNSASLDVRVNGVALVGYTFAVVLTLVTFREMTFIGKVSLGGADVLSLVSGPALGPGMGMDPGYYSILQVA